MRRSQHPSELGKESSRQGTGECKCPVEGGGDYLEVFQGRKRARVGVAQ